MEEKEENKQKFNENLLKPKKGITLENTLKKGLSGNKKRK